MALSMTELAKKHAMKANMRQSEWYGVRSILGNANWALFYVLLGARESGKSYSVMEFFVRQWKTKKIPFVWLRLNEASMKKMLANKAERFVDADIVRHFGLDLTTKGNNVYDHGEKMATILALSTFANEKGVAHFDNEFDGCYNICLDEFQLEKTQKRQGDIAYQFIQQMENLVRSRKDKMKIFLIGNTLEEASDILTLFNFIPEEFGRYKLKNKRCVIDYLPPTEKYKARRKGSVGDILAGEASNFTNEIAFDKSLVTKKKLIRPTAIIVFDKHTKFTLWDGQVIAPYNKEKCKTIIAMRPYQDELFDARMRDQIITIFDNRAFLYKNLITNKKFQKEIALIKPRKQ